MYSKSPFSSSYPIAASSDYLLLEKAACPVFVCACPNLPSCAAKSWPLNLQSKPSIIFWNSLQDHRIDWQMTCRGLKLNTRWGWSLQRDQLVVRVWAAPKSLNEVCGFESCLGQLQTTPVFVQPPWSARRCSAGQSNIDMSYT